MSKRVIPYVKKAEGILKQAAGLPRISEVVKSSLLEYADDLDNAVSLHLTDKWSSWQGKPTPFPKETHKTEIQILAKIYSTFRDREFSEQDLRKCLGPLAVDGKISMGTYQRYNWSKRLERYGLVASRYVFGGYDYVFNAGGHRLLSKLVKKWESTKTTKSLN
ncbi:MAG TPA: hypothetical protein VJJ76_00710 [archaeon]|nr:hypothetical protein [archaeon]